MVSDIHPKAKIGKGTKIHNFVYVEGDVIIGEDCNLRPFVFVCDKVRIGNNVFIGMGTSFTNDKYPPSSDLQFTIVEDNVSIGANVTILPNVTIGSGSIIGAGTVVRHCIPPNSIVYDKRDTQIIKRKL